MSPSSANNPRDATGGISSKVQHGDAATAASNNWCVGERGKGGEGRSIKKGGIGSRRNQKREGERESDWEGEEGGGRKTEHAEMSPIA